MVERNEEDEPSYEIGYKRPPKETQFKPGQRANPRGRPRGSLNKKDVVDRALNKKVAVRRGNKIIKVPVLEAMTDTFTLKAAQGDVKAAGFVINLATKSGVWAARDNEASNSVPEPDITARGIRPSDDLVESVDDTLLSKEEQIELAKLAELIDIGGDVMALSSGDLVRLKQIINKGRGKDVEPTADENLDQAA